MLLASVAALALAAAVPASAQATFPVAFQKLSAADDDVDDFVSGFPLLRGCATPCQTMHVVSRIVNCSGALADGTCVGPNALPVTGGVFTDTPPVTLPLDCSRGVAVSGGGTWDPPTCDTATNTVTVTNVRVPPGETVTVSFWCRVECDSGVVINHAYFQYDQNPTPGRAPLDAADPVAAFGFRGLSVRTGDADIQPPMKNAPELAINNGRRYGGWGMRTPWVVEWTNFNCEPMPIDALWDTASPAGCLEVDCATLRLFVNGVPQPLPPGTLCPDAGRPADWSMAGVTVQPHDTLRITFDATFGPQSVGARCCNLVSFKPAVLPEVQSQDPSLDTGLIPEATCAFLALATSTVVDAIKSAEDAAGQPLTRVSPGDDVYWRITIVNNDAVPRDFALTDDFPAGATLLPGSVVTPFPVGTCTITGQTLACTGVTVPATGSSEMVVRTPVDCAAVAGGADICNEASVSTPGLPGATTHCPGCSPTAPGNLTCVTLDAPSFDFASKSVADASGDGLIGVGERATYTLHAFNTGTSDATSVILTDAAPAGTTYEPGTLALDGAALTDAADGDAGEVVGGAVTVRVGSVPPLSGTVGLVTFAVRFDAPVGARLCNEAALVTWSEAAGCGLAPHPLAPACLEHEPVTPLPDLSATKSVTPTGAVPAGTRLRYAIGTCNAGTGGATGVVVTDAVPSGATYVAGSLTLEGAPLTDAADADEGELVTGTPDSLRVVVGAIAPGACAVVGFDVTVDAAATAPVVNVARVAADGVPAFDSNPVSTAILPPDPPQLSITKSSTIAGGPPLLVGGGVTYELRACNAAAAGDASNVALTDAVPLDALSGCGATFVPGSIRVDGVAQTDAADGDFARFVATPSPGALVVELPGLAAGACVDVTFDVVAATGCDDGEQVVNAATVIADDTGAVVSNSTSDAVSVPPPPAPNLMRQEGFPLANRCPSPPLLCGCEVGPRLDPVLDDCVTAGTCAQLAPDRWTVPGDLDRHVPLVFYEVNGAGCVRAGDPTRLAVTKSLPSDVEVRLVP